MNKDNSIILFNQKEILRHWDNCSDSRYFTNFDIISILTRTRNPKSFWSDLETKLKRDVLRQNKVVVKQGGKAAKAARAEIESKTSESVITSDNIFEKIDK
jgi:hypothetical protein